MGSTVVTKSMGDCYVTGFAPAMKFLRNQILCSPTKLPSDETINRNPPCAHACTEERSRTRVQDPVVYVRVRWAMQNNRVCTKTVRVLMMLKLEEGERRDRSIIASVAGELCKLARVTGPELPHPFSPV